MEDHGGENKNDGVDNRDLREEPRVRKGTVGMVELMQGLQ